MRLPAFLQSKERKAQKIKTIAKPQLKATIEVVDKFECGANPQVPNKFYLSIKNTGEEVRNGDDQLNLFLEGYLGSEAEALFFNNSDARTCRLLSPGDGWQMELEFPSKARFRFTMYSVYQVIFEKNQELKFGFCDVISKTDPNGAALLNFSTGTPDTNEKLHIPKTIEKPDIISFYSIPPEGVLNLPDEDITLYWCKKKLTNLELTSSEHPNPLPADINSDNGFKLIKCTTDETYSLKGYDGSRLVERKLSIKVARRGWYETRNRIFKGEPGFPSTEKKEHIDLEPTMLFSDKINHCYAIFRSVFSQEKDQAYLFQTKNPFGSWDAVFSSQGKILSIPDIYSTSPGIFCSSEKKLWLIGGSLIDQDIKSNKICCVDMAKPDVTELDAGDWEPRMGHTCLMIPPDEDCKLTDLKKKILVFGGFNENGNLLDDALVFDTTSGTIKEEARFKLPCKGIRFSCVYFNKEIWLAGGADDPFPEKCSKDIFIFSGNRWTKSQKDFSSIEGDPIAIGLHVFNGNLHIIGKAQINDNIKAFHYLVKPDKLWEWEVQKADELMGWGPGSAASYQIVDHKEQLFIVNLIRFNEPNYSLKIFVP